MGHVVTRFARTGRHRGRRLVVTGLVAGLLAAGGVACSGDDDAGPGPCANDAVALLDEAPPATTGRPSQLLRVVDLDADGTDEVLLITGVGAATDVVSVGVVVDCALALATLDGSPAQFPVGAAVLHLSGLECRPGADGGGLELVSWTAVPDDALAPVDYEAVGTVHRLRGAELTVEGTERLTVAARSPLFALSAVAC